MVQQSVAAGTVIVAGEQTAGKGRLKRTWLSPPGNIALSIILYPDILSLPYLIMIASLAVVHAVEKITDLKAQIKWPNDILIGKKKVGGILIENEMKGDSVSFSIVGVGINVDLKVADYPEISGTAASLGKKGGEDIRETIIRALLEEFERLYIKLPDGNEIFQSWRGRLVTLGQKVRVISGAQVIEGIAEAVDESGTLVIRQPDGSRTVVVAGDVTLKGE
jgi:BirA family biotin operon repressor/biotin-[acetyl-CoA-carboxylase] ligase